MNTYRHPLLWSFLAILHCATPLQAIIVSHTYDAAGRLVGVNYNGASNTGYAYDKNGNLLSRSNTTNLIPILAGTYNGIVSNTSPSLANSGVITLKISANGSYSGKVTLEGKSYSFSGVFANDGSTADITITRKAPLTNMTLSLGLDVTNGTQIITGTLDNGVDPVVSTVDMRRSIYNTSTMPLPAGLAGKYTALFLPTSSDAAIPQGDGYATVTVSNSGGIMLAGKLANNIGVTQSASMVGANAWLLFVSLHSSKGFLSGNVSFVPNPDVSDFFGSLSWLKPATTGMFHPDEFITDLNFIGSRWAAPPKGVRALDLSNTVPNADFTATEGDLAAPLTLSITLDAANKFIVPADPSKLKLSLTATSGVFTGSFMDSGKTRTIGGVLFQRQNIGSGFFPGSTVSGLVQIEETP
jgi:YD repeat-containing protein